MAGRAGRANLAGSAGKIMSRGGTETMVIMGKGAIDTTKTSAITNQGGIPESITRRKHRLAAYIGLLRFHVSAEVFLDGVRGSQNSG
jgi:hypothetical protein